MFSPENSGREEDTDVDERQQDELQHEEEFGKYSGIIIHYTCKLSSFIQIGVV